MCLGGNFRRPVITCGSGRQRRAESLPRCRLSSTVMVGIRYSSRFWMCLSSPNTLGTTCISSSRVKGGHGVSGSHNQNDLLIAWFFPYEWVSDINEKSRAAPGEDAGLMDEMNDVYCLRSPSLASHTLSCFPASDSKFQYRQRNWPSALRITSRKCVPLVIFNKHIAVSCCDGNRLFATREKGAFRAIKQGDSPTYRLFSDKFNAGTGGITVSTNHWRSLCRTLTVFRIEHFKLNLIAFLLRKSQNQRFLLFPRHIPGRMPARQPAGRNLY